MPLKIQPVSIDSQSLLDCLYAQYVKNLNAGHKSFWNSRKILYLAKANAYDEMVSIVREMIKTSQS